MAATATVRVTPATRAALARLSEREGRPMAEVLAAAVAAYERERFFDEADAQLAAMQRDDPAAWAALREEDRLWEATLADGLDEWPWESADSEPAGLGPRR